MQPITITLDGREVSGHPGITVLDLARESGIDIPTLCHDPHLASVGACRLCLVENEQTRALLASCVTPIASGMIIHTRSPRVLAHRKNILKLMLASHPDSCFVCDKGNRCRLRNLASEMGIGWIEMERIPQIATIDEVNPFLEKDWSKCILCAKCIRACQELVVEGAIDYFGRGFANKPATLNDLPLERSECTFCGTCVALCPTGALMEKERPYRGTARKAVQTTCPFCGCGCSIGMEVKDNRIVRVTPGEAGGINNGALCAMGSYGFDFVHSPDRLTAPLVKRENIFEEVSWECALERVAGEFRRIRHEHGPDSLAVLASSKCTNEENYLLQRFARSILGTNNIDNGSRLYGSAAYLGLGPSTGFSGSTDCLSGLEHSEVILLAGADPPSSAPVVGYAIRRAVRYKGAKLLLIDPRETGLSPFAHLRLRPRPGTDVALFNSLSNVIIDEGLLDEEFVVRRTDNFDALRKTLTRYSPEEAEEITGVPGDQVRHAARLYATANGGAIMFGSGIMQHADGTDCVKALANLALLTGNIGRRGGGIYALQRDNNGQGACDMGALPHFLPGFQRVANGQARKRFEDRWKSPLPARTGLTAVEMMEAARSGKIKGLYAVGENPVISFPSSTLVAEALASLEYLVVQDLFLTETARLANVVFPAVSYAEKDGTFTNFEGRVGRLGKVIAPCGGSLPDWEIVLRLAEAMEVPLPFSSLQQVIDEIEDLVPQYEDYASPGRLYQEEPDTWEVGRTHCREFLRGFARFSPVQYRPALQPPNGDYPLTLVTGPVLYRFGTGVRIGRASRLKKFHPETFAELNETDAQKLGISEGQKIRLISPAGEVTAMARLTGTLCEGMVFMPLSSPAGRLFSIVLDPESKTPSFKTCRIRIEPVWIEG